LLGFCLTQYTKRPLSPDALSPAGKSRSPRAVEPQPGGISRLPRVAQAPALFMSLLFPKPIQVGRFTIAPSSHTGESGRYHPAVSVGSGEGASSHWRMHRLDRSFSSRAAAHVVALTHGWAHTFRATA